MKHTTENRKKERLKETACAIEAAAESASCAGRRRASKHASRMPELPTAQSRSCSLNLFSSPRLFPRRSVSISKRRWPRAVSSLAQGGRGKKCWISYSTRYSRTSRRAPSLRLSSHTQQRELDARILINTCHVCTDTDR